MLAGRLLKIILWGQSSKDGIVNGFNIYKVIIESESPSTLLSKMADLLSPLKLGSVKKIPEDIDAVDEDSGVYQNYLHYFKAHNYLGG